MILPKALKANKIKALLVFFSLLINRFLLVFNYCTISLIKLQVKALNSSKTAKIS